jgi:hypothetical protein
VVPAGVGPAEVIGQVHDDVGFLPAVGRRVVGAASAPKQQSCEREGGGEHRAISDLGWKLGTPSETYSMRSAAY